jgi:hypothetical protein
MLLLVHRYGKIINSFHIIGLSIQPYIQTGYISGRADSLVLPSALCLWPPRSCGFYPGPDSHLSTLSLLSQHSTRWRCESAAVNSALTLCTHTVISTLTPCTQTVLFHSDTLYTNGAFLHWHPVHKLRFFLFSTLYTVQCPQYTHTWLFHIYTLTPSTPSTVYAPWLAYSSTLVAQLAFLYTLFTHLSFFHWDTLYCRQTWFFHPDAPAVHIISTLTHFRC